MGVFEMKTVAVIPAYNVEDTVEEVVKTAKKFVDDVIVVNDGSRDKTAEILAELGVRILTHKTNKGLGCALRTGFEDVVQNGFDVVVTLDSDGQHDPCDIKKLVKRLHENKADAIIGSRLLNKDERKNFPRHRLLGNLILTYLTNLASGSKVTTDSQSGCRVIKRRVLEQINLEGERMEIASEIIFEVARNNFTLDEIPIKVTYDKEISNVRAFGDIYRILKILLKKRLGLKKKRAKAWQLGPLSGKR